MDEILTYTGSALNSRNKALQLEAYKPSESLKEAVNLALLLEQPLLIMGEPGCGKTRLAEAVAAELHGEKWKEHYFRWDIKSTTKSKEGFYQYDALNRLYDANSTSSSAKEISNYISYGSFANALMHPQNGNKPNILLIDEIDKADIDFPNDLLLEIERGKFFIPELNQTIEKKSRVFIIVTSNREKELPPAFLRRCLYHYIHFPDKDDLMSIVSARFDQQEEDGLIEKAVNLFLDIRTTIELQVAENEKKPSTSELLEWFRVIEHYRTYSDNGLSDEIKLKLEAIKNYEKGSISPQGKPIPIPFRSVLLKTEESNQLFSNHVN